MPTIFMIRNKITGEYAKAGQNGFSKVGKVWTSSRAFGGHLALFTIEELGRVYKDCEFLTFELGTPTFTQDINAFVERTRKKQKLAKLHGGEFVSFIDGLDKEALIQKFNWIIHVETRGPTDQVKAQAKEAIKRIGIKRADYRHSDVTFAFANRTDAAQFRLAMTQPTYPYDGSKLLSLEDL